MMNFQIIKSSNSFPIYSILIASTGLSFSAFLAGMIADRIPVQKIINERLKYNDELIKG